MSPLRKHQMRIIRLSPNLSIIIISVKESTNTCPKFLGSRSHSRVFIIRGYNKTERTPSCGRPRRHPALIEFCIITIWNFLHYLILYMQVNYATTVTIQNSINFRMYVVYSFSAKLLRQHITAFPNNAPQEMLVHNQMFTFCSNNYLKSINSINIFLSFSQQIFMVINLHIKFQL